MMGDATPSRPEWEAPAPAEKGLCVSYARARLRRLTSCSARRIGSGTR